MHTISELFRIYQLQIWRKTMKRVLFVAIVAIFFAITSVQASDVMTLDLRHGKPVSVGLGMKKDQLSLNISYWYTFDNKEQQKYFQDIFDHVVVAFAKRGWEHNWSARRDFSHEYPNQEVYWINCSFGDNQSGPNNVEGIIVSRTNDKFIHNILVPFDYNGGYVKGVLNAFDELQSLKASKGKSRRIR